MKFDSLSPLGDEQLTPVVAALRQCVYDLSALHAAIYVAHRNVKGPGAESFHRFFGEVAAARPEDALAAFLAGAGSGAYVAIQAYLTPSTVMDRALDGLRMRIRDRFRLAATAGYGPRFLHSTGQLHKGDSGRGPTRLISPRRTLISCGSSSSFHLRNTRPVRVTRGSQSWVRSEPI